MTNLQLLIKKIHVVDPKNQMDGILDVLIQKGKITAIKKDIEPVENAQVFDGSGKYLFPGLIDMHVHMREPGFEQKETIETGSRAALRGGFVAAVAMPNTNPPCDHQSVIDNIIRKANEVPFYIFPAATITKERAGKELSEMSDMKKAGACAVSDDGEWVADSLLMRHALEYASMLDLLLISHAEDRRLSGPGVMNEVLVSTKVGLRGIPSASEEIAIARDLILAEYTGARIHMTHISTAGSVAMIRDAKAKGIKVTSDVTPHHFSLTDEAVDRYCTNFKMRPQLRTEKDRRALIAGLVDGTVDAIASDHAPHTDEEKMLEFQDAPDGVIGLETSLGVALTELVHTKKMDLKMLVEKMSVRPAEILKLSHGFGEIKTGAEANLTCVDVDQEWVVNKNDFVSKSKNSCFVGKKLKGKAVATICRGKLWDFRS